jgi:branched-chain amino acid transport system substrate-binding protein
MKSNNRCLALQSIALICSLWISLPSSAEELSVRIGVPVPITGSEATVGDSLVKGAQIAAQQAKGIKITLDVQDEACDPQAGVNATNKMVADKVTMVVGYYCSGATLPSVTILHRAHIPTIVSAASHPGITAQGYPEIFRVYPTSAQLAPVAAKLILGSWNAKTIAVVHDNTAVQKAIADSTKENLEKGGGRVPLVGVITPKTAEFGVTVAQIKDLNPDAVFLSVYYTEAALLTKQLFAAGYTGKILEGDSLDPHFIEVVGDDIAQKIGYVGPPITEQLPAAKDFIAAYKEKYGTIPDPYTVYQYDAMNVAIAVLKQANSTDPDKIIAALKAYKGKHTTGLIEFDSQGQLTGGPGYRPISWRNGKFVLTE